MDHFTSSSNDFSHTFAFALDGSLPLLVSNDSPNSIETTTTTSSGDMNAWTSHDLYTVIEMNRLLNDMQHKGSPDASTTPPSPGQVGDMSSPSAGFYCCQWVGCATPVYASLDDLVNHVMHGHVGSGRSSYVCGWVDCPRGGRPFIKRHKIMTHIRSHTGERPFICDTCGKRFARHDSLQTHAKVHSKKRTYTCPYAGCDQTFGQVRMLENHERLVHGTQSLGTAMPMQPLPPPLSMAAQLSPGYADDVASCEPSTDLDWSQLLSLDDSLNLLNFY
jgi:hypothetical protein